MLINHPTPFTPPQALLALMLCYALALFPAFIAEWCFNFPGLYALYSNRISYGVDTSLVILLLSGALACLTQYTYRWQKPIFGLLFTLLCFIGLLATAHAKLYAAPISVGAIDALLGTDLHEAAEFLHFQFSLVLGWMLVGFVLILLFGLLFIRPRLAPLAPLCLKSHLATYALLCVLGLFSYQHPAFAAENLRAEWLQSFSSRFGTLNYQVPTLRMIVNMQDWLEYRRWLQTSQTQRALYDYHASLTSNTPRTVVLVIGESMRRGNLSLYGYDKPTTPKLDARRDHLLVYTQAIAPANQTVPSITKILTPATVQFPDTFLERPSIVGAARQAGYKTFWISNQGRVGNFDSMISLFAKEAEVTTYTNTEFYAGTFDSILLDPFSDALKDPAPLKFIVLHIQGSHQDYKKRFPADQVIFSNTQYRNTTGLSSTNNHKKREALAQYDNSIHYTDWLLDQLLSKMTDIPGGSLLYLSDHGERFFENRVMSCGHGYPAPTKQEVEVPFFLWCQNGCTANIRQAYQKHRKTPFSSENTFYNLLTLLAIQTPDYQATLDILNPAYKPYPVKVISTSKTVYNYFDLP
jgi:heptose-I-phosphate ethanolaminephosphotransferase